MRIDKPITIALILFAIVFLIFFLVYPEYETFKALQQDLGIKRAEYNAEFAYYSEITRNIVELTAKSDNIAKVDSALPSDPELGSLVYYMQDQASKSGLVLRSLFLSKVSGSAAKNTVKDLTFSLNLTGNYASLNQFISYLENSARIFEIENINFGSGDTSRDTSQFAQDSIFNFTIQIKTYTY
jgi:Tfp pilus assembly protein PilO